MKGIIILAAVFALAQANAVRKIPKSGLTKFNPRLASSSASLGNRIVNGETAAEGQFPYEAALSIDTDDGYYFCGGALISTKHVLTAAHCVVLDEQLISITVTLGATKSQESEPNQQVFTTTSFTAHESYVTTSDLYDIAIVNLPSEATLNDYVKTVSLAEASSNFEGQTAVLSGWGQLSSTPVALSPTLQYAELRVMTTQECGQYFNEELETLVCTSGENNKGACFGDSGSPLVVDGVQIGVVSFGPGDCGDGEPDFYTSVAYFRDWIDSNL